MALAGIDLDIQPGSCTGLVGPNGAGKTTFLRLLMGLDDPDAGDLAVFGQRPPLPGSLRARIGYAPQQCGLYPQLSAAENLDFFARVYGVPIASRAAAIREQLVAAGLEDVAARRVRGFSTGTAQRVHVGCAMVHGPSLLILDEPTSGVDIQSRRRIYDQVERFRDAGGTVLLTTHLIVECERLCDVVHVLAGGRVVASGTTALLRDRFAPRTISVRTEAGTEVPEAAIRRAGAVRVSRRWDAVHLEVPGSRDAEEVMTALRSTGVAVIDYDIAVGSLEDAIVGLTTNGDGVDGIGAP